MQVRNEAAWQEQLTEFEADEVSRKFRDFLVFWVETADAVLGQVPFEDGPGDPVEGARKALEVAEQTFGYLSVEWIAQMLLVITQHWVHGEQLFEGLSVIEKRLVEQATAMKIAELKMTASMPTGE